MDIYKKIEKINDADKLVTHKRELQQCEFYMYMLTMPLLDEQPFHEAERFANNMYEKIKKESQSIALCNTALTPRYIDSLQLRVMKNICGLGKRKQDRKSIVKKV